MKNFLCNRGIQNGIATALICALTIGGFMVLTDDGGEPPLSSVSVQHYGQTSYHGATGYSTSSGTGMSVVSHLTLDQIGAGGGAASGFSGLSGESGSSVSIGMIGHTTHISGSAFGGGGGVYGGGGGSGSSGSSGVSSGGGGVIAMAAPMLGRAGGMSGSRGMMLEEPGTPGMGVYDGDAPGVITGGENENLDNPIVTSYGQPIGDVLWPLLLMALMYVLWIKKNERKGTVSNRLFDWLRGRCW